MQGTEGTRKTRKQWQNLASTFSRLEDLRRTEKFVNRNFNFFPFLEQMDEEPWKLVNWLIK
jgi:hypothetical protein